MNKGLSHGVSVRTVLAVSAAVLSAGLLALGPALSKDSKPAPRSDEDRGQIEKVLTNYHTAVSTGDEALFMTTLLDDQIPFFSAGEAASQDGSLSSAATRDFASFRRAVFHSGRRYRQSFDRVHIEQDSSLAQVSLHFITREQGSNNGSEGWKVLALLKVGGQWKIASELYTARSLSADRSS
jgi:hypothetical protein